VREALGWQLLEAALAAPEQQHDARRHNAQGREHERHGDHHRIA
jgi:hypothetical protein